MTYVKTDQSTQHGLITPHGKGVPHKMPTTEGESETSNVFLILARQLYPTGRAFNVKHDSVFYNLHLAINVSFLRLIDSAKLTIDSSIPDNSNFSEEDADLWEYRLGIRSNTTSFVNALSLEQRKQAILIKFAYPQNITARQHPFFIEYQLRSAGFNVYVHENRFPGPGTIQNPGFTYRTPEQVANVALSESQHGGESQHGDGFQHGDSQFSVIANTATTENESYSVGPDGLYATFFIGGEILGDFATVPESRTIEFKELVLNLKPAQTVAFTFINFV